MRDLNPKRQRGWDERRRASLTLRVTMAAEVNCVTPISMIYKQSIDELLEIRNP